VNFNDDEEEEDNNDLTGTTSMAEYPWMIELLKKNVQKKNFEYKCGAVLIANNVALTANHCLKSKIPSNFVVRAGEWDRSSLLGEFLSFLILFNLFINFHFFFRIFSTPR
jgi:hypothetical protein